MERGARSSLIVEPVLFAGIGTYPPGAELGPRVIPDYEFLWMMDGDAEYRRGETIYSAPHGSIVLCRPGIVEHFLWDRVRRTRHGYFHFRILSVPPSWAALDEWPAVVNLADDDILRPLFRHYLTWVGLVPPEQSQLTIAQILTLFVHGTSSVKTLFQTPWPASVESTCAYIARLIDEDPAQQITLPQLAREACVSPEHLCRLFKSSLGRPPAETVRRARLDHAAALIQRSNYTVTEVSAICGFASPFHFSRLFKKAFGHSPSAVKHAALGPSPINLPRLREI